MTDVISRVWKHARKIGRTFHVMLHAWDVGHSAEGAIRSAQSVQGMHGAPHSLNEAWPLFAVAMFALSTVDSLTRAYLAAKRVVDSKDAKK